MDQMRVTHGPVSIEEVDIQQEEGHSEACVVETGYLLETIVCFYLSTPISYPVLSKRIRHGSKYSTADHDFLQLQAYNCRAAEWFIQDH